MMERGPHESEMKFSFSGEATGNEFLEQANQW